VKTPFYVIVKPVVSKAEPWIEINPKIFKEKSLQFKYKILSLQIINTSFHQQPCET